MSMHSAWLRHLHMRKKTHKKTRSKAKKIAKWLASNMLDEQLKNIWYENKILKHATKWQKIMDKLIYVVALIWPILTIPQVWMVWVEKNSAWLSLFTWTAYVVSPTLWLIYGIVHKEKAIIFSNILWIIVDMAVLVWAIIYW